MRLLGRALAWCIGLILAIPAGTLVLVAGALVEPAAGELLGALGAAGLEALLDAVLAAPGPDPAVAQLAVGLMSALLATLVVPPAFVALLGEVAGVRAAWFYGGLTGLVTAALPWLTRARFAGDPDLGALPAEGRLTALLFLTGAAAGLVYWAVAGQGAGGRRQGSSGPPTARP